MNGQHYNRALRVHKQEEHGNTPEQPQVQLESVVHDLSGESVLNALWDEGCGKLLHEYNGETRKDCTVLVEIHGRGMVFATFPPSYQREQFRLTYHLSLPDV